MEIKIGSLNLNENMRLSFSRNNYDNVSLKVLRCHHLSTIWKETF